MRKTTKGRVRARRAASKPAPRNTPIRVLDADVYDFLELSAWVHGGIGAGRSLAVGTTATVPLCMYGHAFCGAVYRDYLHELLPAIERAGLGADANDRAVRAINKRHGATRNARVPFGKWCKELGVVRAAGATSSSENVR